LKVLLAHTPEMRRNYYGERSLKSLQALAEVILHQGEEPLDAAGLVRAAGDADIIVADRMTEGRGEIFPQLPKLRALVRCAVDIRNVNVEAASQAGVLVTRAGPGFIQAVAELALGFMVDLSRGVSRTTADYKAARKPDVRMGRQLAGSRIGHHRLWHHRALSLGAGEGAPHGGAGLGSIRVGQRSGDQAGRARRTAGGV
jgi:D-3-phosphoglycerate dehydrogenase / 2-oxoglutarate reductase